MKLIVGLGNPGARYRQTLHNIGFEVVDELARRKAVAFESAPAEALVAKFRHQGSAGSPGSGLGGELGGGLGETAVLLAKPLTFMNVSGRAVGDLHRYFKIPLDEVLVIVDDVNLPAGQLRARAGGSAGGHNGLKSIIAALGTDRFPRLRVGVGRGDPRRELADHVLGRVPADLRDTLAVAVETAAEAAELFVAEGIAPVMNRFNRRPQSPPQSAGDGDDEAKAKAEKAPADRAPADRAPADRAKAPTD